MMNQIKYLVNGGARLLRWPLRCGLVCLALARVALATDPLYQIDYPVIFTVAPNVHATNFVNNATPFAVDIASSGSTLSLFETWNTLNYTNNGSIIASPGFYFDTQVTNAFGNTVHLMAANFYNPGTITCGSELIVSATNIAMPGGTVAVGSSSTVVVSGSGGTIGTITTSTSAGSGLISIIGQNVDLSSSTLTLGSGSAGGMGSVAAIPNSSSYYYAGFGQDTNVDWDPSVYLTASSATPSLVRMGTVSPADWEYPFGDGAPFPTASALAQ
jgi:hypothetical protein